MSVRARSPVELLQGVRPHTSPEFELQDVVCGGRHTLLLTGELDIASAPVLHEALAEACTDATTALVLDLRKLTFMDSTGVKAVVVAKRLCAQHGCEFLVIPGHAQVLRLFEISGLLDQLPLQVDQSGVDAVLSRGDSHTGTGS